ncbi:MAG: NADPH:quinone oxidoreductase family protein [Gammaproteobacteria bacterium]|nr:NADPH:quinone oxidoreductase family protein [Gammaproteobacteria bacterium]
MRAILCKAYGSADTLVIEDVASPVAKGSGVKVRVRAAGLNFPDTLIIEGKYQFQPPLPFSPGGEMAGDVIEVGDKVTRFKVGDRVMGLTGYGAFAEEIVVAENNLLPVPMGMSDEEAAAFTMVYGTSWYALKQRAALREGETLLVLGASGGVGLAAVELGKVLGARVIAAASSADKLAVAREAGADELVNYTEEPLKDAVKRLTRNQGVDVIYDPVGGSMTEDALRCMAWNGRHLIVGFAAGDIPKIPANLTLLKGCSVVGVFWGQFTMKQPAESAENMKELLALYGKGQIRPRVSAVYPFERYADALGALTGRAAKGKVVLKVG